MRFLRLIVILIFFSIKLLGFSQTGSGFGLSAMYNYQTGGFGLGLRMHNSLGNNFVLAPQLFYYPMFNPIHELYLGANLHWYGLRMEGVSFYLIGGGFLNFWFNEDEFTYSKAKKINMVPKVGGGIIFGKSCIRPFIEQRYTWKWKETVTHVGVFWYFGCKGRGGRGGRGGKTYFNKSRGSDYCPAYH